MDNHQTTCKATNHRKWIIIAVVVILSSIILLTFHRKRYSSVVYESEGTFRIFKHFRVTNFPWRIFSVDPENDIAFPSEMKLNDVHAKGTKKFPNAIIIGAKKAGTRALLEFIRVHPSVRAAGHEVHYFDKNYSLGQEWYRSMMPTSIDNQITLEKTPSYLVTPEAPARVFDLDPNMKIIIVVKDPVARAVSDYTQSLSKHRRRKKFEEFVFLNLKTFEVNKTRVPIVNGMYSKHLENWLRHFPLQQFCFINGETLITDPAVELKKLQDFLEIKQVITDEHFYFNSTKGFPCLKKREASGAPHCLGEGKGRVHPEVSSPAMNALYNFFMPHNIRFYEMTGIDFNWEKHRKTPSNVDRKIIP